MYVVEHLNGKESEPNLSQKHACTIYKIPTFNHQDFFQLSLACSTPTPITAHFFFFWSGVKVRIIKAPPNPHKCNNPALTSQPDRTGRIGWGQVTTPPFRPPGHQVLVLCVTTTRTCTGHFLLVTQLVPYRWNDHNLPSLNPRIIIIITLMSLNSQVSEYASII